MCGLRSKQNGSATIVTMVFMTLGGIVVAVGAMSFFAIYMQFNAVQMAADAAASAGWQQVNGDLTEELRGMVAAGIVNKASKDGDIPDFPDKPVIWQWEQIEADQQNEANYHYCQVLSNFDFERQAKNHLEVHYPSMELLKCEVTKETPYEYTFLPDPEDPENPPPVIKQGKIVESYRIQVGQQLRSPVFQDLLEGIQVKAWSRTVQTGWPGRL